jgi:hypothetical protein
VGYRPTYAATHILKVLNSASLQSVVQLNLAGICYQINCCCLFLD